MISDTLISPRADKAIRSRSSEFKRRAGHEHFKDILRQRCRERVKARRGALFDHLRFLKTEESMRNALSQYIENDLKEIQRACILEDRDIKESMDIVESDEPLSRLAVTDREKWILEEYERLIDKTNAQVEMQSLVVCPLCARGVLSANSLHKTVTCSLCSLLLPYTVPLEEVEKLIFQAIEHHERTCPEQPHFTVCPDNYTLSNLILLCSTCGCISQIV